MAFPNLEKLKTLEVKRELLKTFMYPYYINEKVSARFPQLEVEPGFAHRLLFIPFKINN